MYLLVQVHIAPTVLDVIINTIFSYYQYDSTDGQSLSNLCIESVSKVNNKLFKHIILPTLVGAHKNPLNH